MDLESPQALLTRLNLGREEYCQRLLTMLILDAPYPPWNNARQVSPRGATFLADLDELSFGDHSRTTPTTFVDEFELLRRHENEKTGGPDWAIVWDDRLWMIELKTEAASHRPDQLPHYFDLAAHHHPSRHVDVAYLTPPLKHPIADAPPDTHLAHLTWSQVMPLVKQHWADGTDWDRSAVRTLDEVLAGIGTSWTAAKPGHVTSNEVVTEGLALASETAADGVQRAIDNRASGLDQLGRWRQRLDHELRALPGEDPRRYARPWAWSAQTSGGVALTPAGAETGYELRLSRYEEDR